MFDIQPKIVAVDLTTNRSAVHAKFRFSVAFDSFVVSVEFDCEVYSAPFADYGDFSVHS